MVGAERDVSVRRCESCRSRGFRRIMSLAQKNFLLALNLLAASLAPPPLPLPLLLSPAPPPRGSLTRNAGPAKTRFHNPAHLGGRGKGEGGQRKRERERATRPERHNRVNYYE